MKGFSAVELLVYIGVLTIVLGAITFFTFGVIQNERSIADRVHAVEELDFAMRQVIDQIRAVKSIYPEPTSFFSSGGFSSILALENTDSSGTGTVMFSVVPGGTDQYLQMSDGITTRRLTSPMVYVDRFSLVCISAQGSCTGSPEAVQVRLGLRNTKTQEFIEITTGAIPRGF